MNQEETLTREKINELLLVAERLTELAIHISIESTDDTGKRSQFEAKADKVWRSFTELRRALRTPWRLPKLEGTAQEIYRQVNDWATWDDQ